MELVAKVKDNSYSKPYKVVLKQLEGPPATIWNQLRLTVS